MTPIMGSGSVAVSMLSASVGPDGARAQVLALTNGTAGVERDPYKLRELAAQVGNTGILNTSEDRSARAQDHRDEATARRVSSIRARMVHLQKALSRLQQASQGTDGAAIGGRTGAGNDALAIWTTGGVRNIDTGAGNDAVAIRAAYVEGVTTGSGSDALAISADAVEGVFTDGTPGRGQAGDDAVAIQASTVHFVSTGAGNDAVAIRGDVVSGVFTDSGDDSVAIAAGAVRHVDTGAGDDTVVVDAVFGLAAGAAAPAAEAVADPASGMASGLAEDTPDAADESSQTPAESGADAALRLRAAQAYTADIDLNDGNDRLSVRVDQMIAVKGGKGDDSIAIGGGTVALLYSAGDGNDLVSLSQGSSLLIQLDKGDSWSAAWDGDALVVTVGDGAMRIEGAGSAAAIGIGSGESVELLHVAPPVDLTL